MEVKLGNINHLDILKVIEEKKPTIILSGFSGINLLDNIFEDNSYKRVNNSSLNVNYYYIDTPNNISNKILIQHIPIFDNSVLYSDVRLISHTMILLDHNMKVLETINFKS